MLKWSGTEVAATRYDVFYCGMHGNEHIIAFFSMPQYEYAAYNSTRRVVCAGEVVLEEWFMGVTALNTRVYGLY